MRTIVRDLREAARALVSSPATSGLAIIILAVGLGTAVAAFCAVDALLFRDLPVRDPGRLVRLFTTPTRGGTELDGISLPLFRAYGANMPSLEGLALYREGVHVNVSVGRELPEPVSAALVSGNFFTLLDLDASRGRLLTPSDDEREGGHPVAVLSHALWSLRFGANNEVVGTVIRVNGHPFHVVGIAPRGFHGVGLQSPPGLFLTIAMSGLADPVMRGQVELVASAFFQAVGRLHPDATLSRAQAEAYVIATRTGAGQAATSGPEAEDSTWRVPWPRVVFSRDMTGLGSRQVAWLTTLAVLIVLLIAVADTSGVLMARSERRVRELGIRMALGASRARVLRERVLEGLLLAGAAAAAGVALAAALFRALDTVAALPDLPIETATSPLSFRVLAMSTGLACLVGVAASLAPAIRASSADPLTALRGLGSGGRTPRFRYRSALVAVQVALSMSLLAAAGLLLGSLRAASQLSPGFNVESMLVASLDAARAGYDAERALTLQQQLMEGFQAIPGVTSVAVGTSLPFSRTMQTTALVDGRSERVFLEAVTSRYAATLGLPLVRGRDFTAADDNGAATVALVNEAAAVRLWPNDDPIGKRITGISPRRLEVEIVGVVRARTGEPRDPSMPLVLVPRARFYGAFPFQQRTALFIRTDRVDAETVAPAVLRAVRAVNPDGPVMGLRTAREQVSRILPAERRLAALLGTLAMVALLLASTGLFGIISATTDARRREIGIRVAIGAGRRRILTLVLGHTARLVGAGILLGLPLAFVVGRLLSRFLFGITPYDLLVLTVTAGILVIVALMAAAMPVRRALAVAPTQVMRAE